MNFTSDPIIFDHNGEQHTMQFDLRIYGIHNDVQVHTVVDGDSIGEAYNGNPNKTMQRNIEEAVAAMQNEITKLQCWVGSGNVKGSNIPSSFGKNVSELIESNLANAYKDAERAYDAMTDYPSYKLPIDYDTTR